MAPFFAHLVVDILSRKAIYSYSVFIIPTRQWDPGFVYAVGRNVEEKKEIAAGSCVEPWIRRRNCSDKGRVKQRCCCCCCQMLAVHLDTAALARLSAQNPPQRDAVASLSGSRDGHLVPGRSASKTASPKLIFHD